MPVKYAPWANFEADLTRIRHKVFVVEQGVSPKEELDGEDGHATHFLYYLENKAVGCVRVLHTSNSYQIGRLAVFSSYRLRGYATDLLNHCLLHILKHVFIEQVQEQEQEHQPRIFLHAQNNQIAFYTQRGFVTQGDSFLDANIPHTQMVLTSTNVENISEHLKRTTFHLFSALDIAHYSALLTLTTLRDICILSDNLERNVFGDEKLIDRLSQFARSSASAKVRVLIKDTKTLSGSFIKLVELSKRLSSKIQIKLLSQAILDTHTIDEYEQFFCFDKHSAVTINNQNGLHARIHIQSPARTRRQHDLFHYLWEGHSQPDPNLRRLNL